MKVQDIIKNKATISGVEIDFPRFDRADVSTGIVHIGVGRFHRAHQAAYIQDILNAGDLRWGICGVCLLPQDKAIVDAFKSQDGYYTLAEQSQHGTKLRIIGSMVDIIAGYENPQAVIDKLADPQTHIISLTVTEAGYFYHPSTLELQWEHPVIQHDVSSTDQPKTIYGYIHLALKARMNAGLPVTVQSCDNIQGNGELLHTLLRAYVAKVDADMLPWFDSNISFPNAMVDRITPGASDNEKTLLSKFGIEDDLAIVAEPARQWVLEDEFKAARPDFASVGVQMTASVKPYEHMKVRLLNAGHSAIGYLGALAGINTIHEILEQPVMNQFLKQFLVNAAETVPSPEGIFLPDYQELLVERFSNPTLGDQTLRICKDGAAKIPGFVLPSLLELLERDGQSGSHTTTFALVFAAWYQFVAQNANNQIPLDDAEADKVNALLKASNNCAQRFYQDASLFGELAKHETFLGQVEQFSQRLVKEKPLDVVKSI